MKIRDSETTMHIAVSGMTRRTMLRTCLMAGSCVASRLWTPCVVAAHQRSSGARFLGLANFVGEPEPGGMMGQLTGKGLDSRLYTNLAMMEPHTRVTSTEEFYVRTGASTLLPDAASWRIRLRAVAGQSLTLSVDDLVRMSRPCGEHLMECAGNVSIGHFGLISVADWEGVPLTEVLERIPAGGMKERRVRISGFDRYPAASLSSSPGASWIFTMEELAATGAFLATAMNGRPLKRDHGAPVRLMVPGWYGCCCIKWVNEIAMVGEHSPATSQMREYASRTHQNGVPSLAREYQAPAIDPAAMPVRVEKWRTGEKIGYRVIGILWGTPRPLSGLQIQFNPGEPFTDVDDLSRNDQDGWSFWTHAWMPLTQGRYTLRLRLRDRAIRTRRLDSGHYRRTVIIQPG